MSASSTVHYPSVSLPNEGPPEGAASPPDPVVVATPSPPRRFTAFRLALLGGAVAATLIISRFLWVFPSIWIPRAMSPALRERDPMPPWSHATILSWAGMRGVVSLATALALPARFPGRDLIVFLAFCAILATLVLQGTTLGWLIRRLGVEAAEDEQPKPDTTNARSELAAAALAAVKAHGDGAGSQHTKAAAEVVQEYETRAERANVEGQDPEAAAVELEAQHKLRLVAIEAARAKLGEHTDRIDGEAHRALGEELDLEEQQIRRVLGDAT